MVERQCQLKYEGRVARERIHYNRVVEHLRETPLRMSEENIQRYSKPAPDTPYALEFAYHLLGDLRGKTVLDLGCGDGLNTVILAALGASVIGVDISEENLAVAAARARENNVASDMRLIHGDISQLPIQEGSIDRVLGAAILHHVDLLAAASEIHRVLKPGRAAVFLEPMAGPSVLRVLKQLMPKGPGVSPDEQPLTNAQVLLVNKFIGMPGRRRQFGLTYRLIARLGITWGFLVDMSHRFDAWLLKYLGIAQTLASPLVWEAVKPAVVHSESIG